MIAAKGPRDGATISEVLHLRLAEETGAGQLQTRASSVDAAENGVKHGIAVVFHQKSMSRRSFSLVDHKVAEAEFFLAKLGSCRLNFFAAQCYAGAFVASARSITFALQAVLSDSEGFPSWYGGEQKRLRSDRTAKFFQEFRNVNQHIGDNLVSGGSMSTDGTVKYWFQSTPEIPDVLGDDVMTACTVYFRLLLSILFDCYIRFGPVIDGRQRYTQGYFEAIGKTIEDAEEECGFPRGWTDIDDPASLPYRWQVLRDQAGGCEIDHIFETYLGKTTPCPERLEPYVSLTDPYES